MVLILIFNRFRMCVFVGSVFQSSSFHFSRMMVSFMFYIVWLHISFLSFLSSLNIKQFIAFHMFHRRNPMDRLWARYKIILRYGLLLHFSTIVVMLLVSLSLISKSCWWFCHRILLMLQEFVKCSIVSSCS